MQSADFDIGVGPTLASRSCARIAGWILFALLCAFTLTTFDGGDIAPRLLSALLLLLAAGFFALPLSISKLSFQLPAVCLFGMTVWGFVQTLLFPVKVLSNGWDGVLFWLTAAIISLVGSIVFANREMLFQFRVNFGLFASLVAMLGLLEQASHARKYFWLIPSRYNAVFGTFAYWNNFAQFIELALPITLWRGLSHRRPNMFFLALSALQICAVVASGSRAGSVLVLLELIAVVAIACYRKRDRQLMISAAAAIGVTALFIYAAGFSSLVHKLQQPDQLAVRRNINQSSLAMVKVRPITGWGLNTYVDAYRQFALYDDGTYVNRAHNDWLQFAAEGGLPFAGLFAFMYVWSIRPACRSVWGLGLIAIGLHAAVDYPFARFGVCGWYFALLSAMSYQTDSPSRESTFLRKSVS